jgi:peptidoglycan/xylan/chitin deacetylase (PgdA/CDA1 family)
VPSFREHVETQRLWRTLPGLERVERGVALTFDDGPDEDSTPAVLEALDELGARATFFLAGEQVERHPEIAGEIARGGHALGLHCFRHESMQEWRATEARDDLLRGLDAIEAATGERPRIFRPPYGRLGPESYAVALAMGLEVVYWSAWGMDWEPLPPERIADLVTRDLARGAIVLLHDSPRYGHRPSALATAEALHVVGEACAREGLELVRLAR